MDQFQRSTQIKVKLTSFVHWIKQSVDIIIFGEKDAKFLNKKWSYKSKFDSKLSRIFLFGHHENEYLRVMIAFDETSNKVTGEIRFRNINRSYELLAMFSGDVNQIGENILGNPISKDVFVEEMWKEVNEENYISESLNELVDKEYIKSIKIQKSSVKDTKGFEEWKKFLDNLKISNIYIDNFLDEDLKPGDLEFLTVEELSEFIPKLSDRTKVQKHLQSNKSQ